MHNGLHYHALKRPKLDARHPIFRSSQSLFAVFTSTYIFSNIKDLEGLFITSVIFMQKKKQESARDIEHRHRC